MQLIMQRIFLLVLITIRNAASHNWNVFSHKRMEATRLRKENQIYSVEEKKMLTSFSKDERDKKEQVIMAQFKTLLEKKTEN